MYKRNIVLLILLLIALSACTNQKTDLKEEDPMDMRECSLKEEIPKIDNTTTFDAFLLWQHAYSCSGLQLIDNTLTFQEGATKASIQTGVFELEPFLELVPSWNIIIDDNVKIRIRVAVSTTQELEEPFLMAYWRENYKTSLANQSNAQAYVSIDTIVAKDTPLRYVSFLMEFEEGDFTFQNLSITTKPESSSFTMDTSLLENTDILVPPLQQLSIPVIGSSICSPTSLTMVLQYYNKLVTPSETAGLVRDEGAQIYGNWSFNASFAGGFEELYSRVEFIDHIEQIMAYLQEGTPLILSIRTTSKDQLDGSIMSYSSGHLVVLRGLIYEQDQWVALVNDPAEYTNENVLRHYPLDQLLEAWRGITYIVQDTPFVSPILE